MSQLFTLGGQTIGLSASASVLLMNIQDLFPLGWNGLICLQSKGLSRVFSNTTVQKHQFFGAQLSLWSNSHPYMTIGKTIALTRCMFVGKVISLLFNILSRLVIAFFPRSKHILFSMALNNGKGINMIIIRLILQPLYNAIFCYRHCLKSILTDMNIYPGFLSISVS